MDSRGKEPPSAVPSVGLCQSCRHMRLIQTSRRSTFYLCRLSEKDTAYARYPRLPVVKCAGFELDSEKSINNASL
jgi:hypothetical protein